MIYVFGNYTLDMKHYELRLGRDLLHVEPKVFDLLAHLIQHHGQFVSKEDLHAHLWPDQFVGDSSLTYCVTAARKAIGDDGRVQRIIKTVYGRGYRFIAPVQERLRGNADEEVTDDRPLSPGLRALEGERRQLTVLWCRVVAGPILSEHLDPEELHEVMQDIYNVYAEVIRRFEGHTAQHFADGLMVYFGYPHAHEDDAHRAVRTALEMVRGLGKCHVALERKHGVKLTVRVGIHTGLVVVGEIGSAEKRQQLALGTTPHIAAQLAGLAESGTVAMSPATLKLVEGYFVCQALGSHMLEELPQPLAVYQVLQESGIESRFAAAVTIGLTPFVGRREEVGLLRQRWQQVRRGLGQVVLLSGEAGMGKSRLLQVLQERLATGKYTTIEYRCSPYHQHSAFYPVVTHVQRWLQWHQDDAPQVKLRKLEAALESHDLVLDEAVPLFTSLLLLPLSDGYPPLKLAPQRQKQKTLDALLALLLKHTEAQPVCLIVEDLHWADPSTLELLGLLMDQVQISRMLLLLAFRPDFRPPWTMRSYVTHITLSRLTARQVERMITRITRGKTLPTEVVQQLVVKSDGVPLFVEEMTRMVLDSGLVKERDGQYALAGPLTPLAIPSTLHDLLMARIDRLGTDKQVAQLGATLGREFSYEVIRAVSHLEESALQQALAHLVDAELLYRRGLLPQAQYIFKHVLVQETAYHSLLRSTRRQHHKRIARVLEKYFPEIQENQPELLAHHYTEAGLTMQALTYWQQASQYAMTHSAHLEAIAHLQQGLRLVTALPETAERHRYELTLQTALGVALSATRGYAAPEVERAYDRARELCKQVGDTAQLFTVLRGLWLCYLVRGALQTAYEFGEQLLHLAQSKQERTSLLEAHRALGASLFFLGKLIPALTHLEQGIMLYEPQQHHELTLRYGQDPGMVCYVYAAWILWLRGYPDQALGNIHEALTLAQQCAHPFCLAFARIFAVMIHRCRREAQAVHEQVETCLTLAHEYGFPVFVAMGMTFQGWVLAEQGQGDEGAKHIYQGIAAYRGTGAELFRPYFLALVAEVFESEGRADEGLDILAEALMLVDTTEERLYEAELYRLKGQLLLAIPTDNQTAAEACLRQALTIAHSQQAKSLELRASVSLSRLWQRQGKREQSRQMLEWIYCWFTEGFDTANLREAKALLEELR